jgi:hypothetical protein
MAKVIKVGAICRTTARCEGLNQGLEVRVIGRDYSVTDRQGRTAQYFIERLDSAPFPATSTTATSATRFYTRTQVFCRRDQIEPLEDRWLWDVDEPAQRPSDAGSPNQDCITLDSCVIEG